MARDRQNRYEKKFNGRGERRLEIRVKYVNGTTGLWGYCDDPLDEDALRAAEASPSVIAARVMNPKTGKPFELPYGHFGD